MRKKSKGGGEPIETWDGIFADPEVGRVLKSKGLIADANKSSIEELATITTLNPTIYPYTGYFYNNTAITKFPELQYCTGLSNLWGVFSGCSNLTEAPIIPEGVTDMREAFYGCSNLTEAPIIPSNVTNMDNTFNSCNSLINAPTIPEGVTNMKMTFSNCSSLINAPTIPNSVTNMNMTFFQCYSLVKAPIIPDSVTDMSYTFFRCRKLDSIFIIKPINPPSYSDTFESVNVVAIYVPDESVDVYKTASGWSSHSSNIYPMSDYWDGIFADPEVGRVLYANGLIANANKSSIGELATITTFNTGSYNFYNSFYNNKVITKFPELQYCTGLSDLTYAFYGCSNLTEVGAIPEGITEMGYTFYECSGLISAPAIPESVTNMTYTFSYCFSLDDIFIIKPINPPIFSGTFQGASIRAIYVPDESVNTYKSRTGWSDYADMIYPMSSLPE